MPRKCCYMAHYEGMPYTYMWSVRITTFAVEQQQALRILSECVCSFSYPACNAHALPYTVICGLAGSTTFFYIALNGAVFRKNVFNIKCVCVDFHYNFSLKHFPYRENFQYLRYMGHGKFLCKLKSVILVAFNPAYKLSKYSYLIYSINPKNA
jgi:hypothetical protein